MAGRDSASNYSVHRDETVNSVKALERLVMPKVSYVLNTVANPPYFSSGKSQEEGALMYESDTKTPYFSDGQQWVPLTGGSGEANTIGTVGAGQTLVGTPSKSGVQLRVKTISSDASITLTSAANDLGIRVTNPVPAPGVAGNTLVSNGSSWTIFPPGSNGSTLVITGGVPTYLPPGTSGQTLTISGGAPVWASNTNTLANVGAGTGLIFRDQIGTVSNIKSLIAGTNVTIVNGTDDITISATGGGGGGALVYYNVPITGTAISVKVTASAAGITGTHAPGTLALVVPLGVQLHHFRIQGTAANLSLGMMTITINDANGAAGFGGAPFNQSGADAIIPVVITADGLFSSTVVPPSFSGNSFICTGAAANVASYTYVPSPYLGAFILSGTYLS